MSKNVKQLPTSWDPLRNEISRTHVLRHHGTFITLQRYLRFEFEQERISARIAVTCCNSDLSVHNSRSKLLCSVCAEVKNDIVACRSAFCLSRTYTLHTSFKSDFHRKGSRVSCVCSCFFYRNKHYTDYLILIAPSCTYKCLT